jgi:phage tail sheath gpL-like
MANGGGINFTYYPDSNRVPGVYVEMDPSQANTATVIQSTLIIAQRNGGDGPNNLPIQVQSQTQVEQLAGINSMMTAMVKNYLQQDPFCDLWIMMVPDDTAGQPATGSILLGGMPTEDGTLNVYIAGQCYQAAVQANDQSARTIGRLIAAVRNDPYAIVSVTRDTTTQAQMNITANFLGTLGNQIDIRLNYLGRTGGQKTPAGMTATITRMTGGTTYPDLTTGLANLADRPFDFIVMPFSNAPALNAIQEFLSDNSGRWSWQTMLYGGCFTAIQGSLGNLTAFGIGRNDQHTSVMGYYDSPDPPWVWSAQVGGSCAASLRVDPGLPLQYIGTTLKAPPTHSRFTLSERNTLLYDGVSTFRVNQAGQVIIERMCTTYQQNLAGAPDNSYLDVETMYGLMFVARDLTNYLLSRYARKKLVSDTTIIQPGSNCVNTIMIGASVVSEYRALEAGGYVQNSTIFAANLIVENAGNGLVKILAPVDLVNQLRQIAILLQFRKS